MISSNQLLSKRDTRSLNYRIPMDTVNVRFSTGFDYSFLIF